MEDLVLYILSYIMEFISAIFFTRAIFSIPKFLKIQKAKLQVLTEIAIQQGVQAHMKTWHYFFVEFGREEWQLGVV